MTPDDAEFEVTTRFAEDGSTAVVSVEGDLDIFRAPAFGRTLLAAVEAGAQAVVIDLRDVPYIDSSGLGALVDCAKALSPVHGELTLVVTSPHVLKVLSIMGLDRIFTIIPRHRLLASCS